MSRGERIQRWGVCSLSHGFSLAATAGAGEVDELGAARYQLPLQRLRVQSANLHHGYGLSVWRASKRVKETQHVHTASASVISVYAKLDAGRVSKSLWNHDRLVVPPRQYSGRRPADRVTVLLEVTLRLCRERCTRTEGSSVCSFIVVSGRLGYKR